MMNDMEFQNILKQHRRAMLSYAYTCCRDLGLAEDIVQEAMLIAYQKRGQYFPEADFFVWLISITRNVWFRERKRRVREGTKIQFNEAIETNAAAIFAESMYSDEVWQTKRNALIGCLGKLKTDDRQLIELHFVGCLRYAQIADRMRRTLVWVKVRMHRLREILLDCIQMTIKAEEAIG